MASDAAEPRNGGPTIRMLSFVTTGMRADVTQHFSLAQALKRDGFLVTILSNAIHEDLARIAGCAFVPLKGDPHALLKGAAFREAVESETTGMLKMATIFKGAAEAVLEENMDIMHQHCRKSDGILCALPHVTECMAVAQKYQIPLILCPLLPFSPNGEVSTAFAFGTDCTSMCGFNNLNSPPVTVCSPSPLTRVHAVRASCRFPSPICCLSPLNGLG